MTMERKRIEKEREKFEDKEFLEQWQEKMKHMKEDEKQEIDDIKSRAKNLQSYHKYQMEIRKKKADEDFRIDVENVFKTNWCCKMSKMNS